MLNDFLYAFRHAGVAFPAFIGEHWPITAGGRPTIARGLALSVAVII
jgi:hypothetical protein